MPTGEGPPSGTVTLLFTDIEGSTRLLLRLGERYGDVLAEHRRLLRDAWSAHGGTEIDTQGDSFFVAFTRAADAVDAAVDGQRFLAAHPWPDETALRVRMGIHTGEPSLHDGNYVGIDVHRAARIAAAGHGGQVLVSRTTAALLPTELPDGVTLRELGRYALKDLDEPERLFQLEIPGLESRFPELKSAPSGKTNIATASTPLVGRERELAEARAILDRDDVRLLTLTGPGGTGKTRLAVALAAAAIEDFPDGAYMVSLEPIEDPDLVLQAIAATLPLGERPVEPLAEWLSARLQERRMLIVLDNFEQVVGAAGAVAELLASAPGPKLIVTSRESLRVSAEHEYPVPPLDLPGAVPSDPAALDECASVTLLLARAQAARPDFRLTPDNAGAVADICARLDGLPLAIELAAPWLRILEPAALLDKLGERLDLLAVGVRDLPERQRTLRGAIDWSYRLLAETERALFDWLGIFAGGWTLEAAEAVCAPVAGGTDLLVALGSLIDKNLVRRQADGAAEARFTMLESIRSFALERLDVSGDRAEVSERHAEVYLILAERAERELVGPGQSVWMDRLAADLDNLRAAMSWAVATPGDIEIGLRLAGALSLFWFFLGQYREGLDRSERLLDVGSGASPAARAKALLAAGLLGMLIGDEVGAKLRLEEGLGLSRELGDTSAVARCLDWLGLLAFFRDEIDEPRRLLEESAENARAADDLWCLADALGTLSSILPLRGALAASDAASGEALEIARRAGDQQGVRMALFGRTLSAVRAGEPRKALAVGDEGLAISRAIGDAWFVSYFQWLRAVAAVETGDLDTARRAADESVSVARLVEGPLLIVCALDASAAVARAQGDAAAATASLEEARQVAAGGGVPTSYTSSVVKGLGALAAARGETDVATRLLETSEEMARDVRDPWATAGALLARAETLSAAEPTIANDLSAEALRLYADMGARLGVAETLDVCASAAADRREFHRAAKMLGAADALLDAAGAARPLWRRRWNATTMRAAREALGDEGYAAAAAEGNAERWEQSVRDALEGT